MKNLLLLLCFIMNSAQFLKAQKTDSTTAASRQKLYEHYWQKRNNKKTIGWVLLGSGVTFSSIGAIQAANTAASRGSDYVDGSNYILFLGGFVASLSSIPFFISAGSNKRKARLALNGEQVSFGNGFVPNSTYAAVSIKLSL